jgi:hypothetical protein
MGAARGSRKDLDCEGGRAPAREQGERPLECDVQAASKEDTAGLVAAGVLQLAQTAEDARENLLLVTPLDLVARPRTEAALVLVY